MGFKACHALKSEQGLPAFLQQMQEGISNATTNHLGCVSTMCLLLVDQASNESLPAALCTAGHSSKAKIDFAVYASAYTGTAAG